MLRPHMELGATTKVRKQGLAGRHIRIISALYAWSESCTEQRASFCCNYSVFQHSNPSSLGCIIADYCEAGAFHRWNRSRNSLHSDAVNAR
jgi:hypothetical protein